MKIRSATFIKSAIHPPDYPPQGPPEIAFAGRSNVGKSSLINRLVNRKRLVKTSNTPGRTQMLNFFEINENLIFTDLPGYGYAKVPERVKKNWGPMIETYLSTRTTLKGVVVILDIRRTPSAEDRDLFGWLYSGTIPFLPVLTKTDKLSKMQRQKHHKAAADLLEVQPADLILFSAKTGEGRDALWAEIKNLLEEDE